MHNESKDIYKSCAPEPLYLCLRSTIALRRVVLSQWLIFQLHHVCIICRKNAKCFHIIWYLLCNNTHIYTALYFFIGSDKIGEILCLSSLIRTVSTAFYYYHFILSVHLFPPVSISLALPALVSFIKAAMALWVTTPWMCVPSLPSENSLWLFYRYYFHYTAL